MDKAEKSTLEPCTDLPLNKNELREIVEKAKDWALMNGMLFRPKERYSEEQASFAPFSLLPSSFPRAAFENACQMQCTLNRLMHAVAHDYEFMRDALRDTVQADSFTAKLFNIYETVHKEGFAQKISLAILRSDVMLQEYECNGLFRHKYCALKQVEINTIASGFGWLGPAATHLHKYVFRELGLGHELHNIPENNALEDLGGGMIEAWKIYGDPRSVILFLTEDVTYNICDQKFLEFEIRRQNDNVIVLRRTLTQLADEAKLGREKELLVNGTAVAVVYFRCGYSPSQYYSNKEWNVRLLIERSRAIKCPSIQYHLAGSKKIQQALATPGTVARFLKNEESAARVQRIFTNLYSLDINEQGDSAVKMAIAEPHRFVLKPQREGGGNNLYDNDIKQYLESTKNQLDRTAYILMDRIRPPVQMNYLVRPGGGAEPPLTQTTTELGIFGVVIGDSDKIILNKQAGHMSRSKLASANEGGVMSGFGACDSPFLID